MLSAARLLPLGTTLGEGPLWDAERQRLWLTDILGRQLHCVDPTGAERAQHDLPFEVGALALTESSALILAAKAGFYAYDPDERRITGLAAVEAGDVTTRMNDGACDPAGRFWAGTMDLDGAPGRGALYSLEPDGRVVQHLADLGISNGLAWDSTGGVMYYIDSLTRRIDLFDYDVDRGELSERRPCFDLCDEQGLPDGLAIDDEGALWVALYGGASVLRLDDRGISERVAVDAPHVTSCCFGGPERTTLYITTARTGLDARQLEQYPASGDLFCVDVGVSGPGPGVCRTAVP